METNVFGCFTLLCVGYKEPFFVNKRDSWIAFITTLCGAVHSTSREQKSCAMHILCQEKLNPYPPLISASLPPPQFGLQHLTFLVLFQHKLETVMSCCLSVHLSTSTQVQNEREGEGKHGLPYGKAHTSPTSLGTIPILEVTGKGACSLLHVEP